MIRAIGLVSCNAAWRLDRKIGRCGCWIVSLSVTCRCLVVTLKCKRTVDSRGSSESICCECEMNPDNVAAHALKERLKAALNLDARDREAGVRHPRQTSRDQLWPGVAGMREVKAILERDVILPLQEPELYQRYRVDLPNGILFYGPPGCGK